MIIIIIIIIMIMITIIIMIIMMIIIMITIVIIIMITIIIYFGFHVQSKIGLLPNYTYKKRKCILLKYIKTFVKKFKILSYVQDKVK